MQKSFVRTAILWVAGVMLLGNAMAQQTPASNPQSAPAAKARKAPAAKTAQASAAKSAGALALKTQKDKASYAIGLNIGKNLHKDSVDVSPNILLRGLKDGLTGGKTLLTDDEAKAALVAVQTDVHKRLEVKMQQVGETNKKEGEAFLAANKTKQGVATLPSGLQYKVLKQGTGPKPSATDTVVCNHRGTLLDNTEFDSSYKRGAGADIGPNATLIFEVELLAIQGKGQ